MGIDSVKLNECANNIANDRKNGVITQDEGKNGQPIWVINSKILSETTPEHLPMTKAELAGRYCKDESQIFNFTSGEQSSDATQKVMNGKYFMQD